MSDETHLLYLHIVLVGLDVDDECLTPGPPHHRVHGHGGAGGGVGPGQEDGDDNLTTAS